MYEVQIINRGPEGIRGHKSFRLTKAGSDALHKRMEGGHPDEWYPVLTGLELEATSDAKPEPKQALGGPTRTDATPLAETLKRANDEADKAAKPAPVAKRK